MRALKIEYAITDQSEASMRRYLNEIDKIPLLSMDEEVKLCRKIKEGDKAALDKLVRANLRFVVSCSKKYVNMGMSASDLINEGNIGLITAAERFDESKGFKFISYAVWWIRQSMMLALSRDMRMIYLPQSMVKITADIRNRSERLLQQLQREPTDEEIAAALQLEPQAQAFELASGRSVSSLDNTIQAESDIRVWEVMADPMTVPADSLVMQESVHIQIDGLLSIVSDRERLVLRGFFGFDDMIPLSCGEMGLQLQLTAERVRQIRDSALSKIRFKLAKKGILNAYA